jgi:hypothetical protein
VSPDSVVPGQPEGQNALLVTPDQEALPRSVLLTALRVMGRTASAAVPAILLTAGIQMVLMYLDVQSGFSAAFLASFAVSAVAALALYAVLSACALESADDRITRLASGIPAERRGASDPQRPDLPESVDTPAHGRLGPAALRRTMAHVGPFVGWVAVQWLAMVSVSMVSPWLIALVAVLTPFLPLAAMDGRRSALTVNVRVIGQVFGRWLLTSLILLVLGFVLFLLSAANTLFVQGTPAAILFWLAIGLVAWWLLTVWALVYRSAPASTRRP